MKHTSNLVGMIIATAALVACGAKDKNPIQNYEKGVLPHNTPARDQVQGECGFGFSVDAPLEVTEGSTAQQKITVIGKKSFSGGLALVNAPKGMSIQGNTITYTAPRGIVGHGQQKTTFTYGVMPASQVNKSIQCIANFEGVVTLQKRPQIIIHQAPTEINLDTANSKFTVLISVKADVKSSENISLSTSFDKLLTSAERKAYDLTQAIEVAKTSTQTATNERMFALEIDPEKIAAMINADKNAKKKSEFLFLAVITAKNEENKTTYSKNISIIVKRTVPTEEPKAPAKKAGQ